MHSKKSLIRVITRILYAGGFVFLIVGLLLSALSTTAMAAGTPSLNMSAATTQVTPPNCNCTTVTPQGTKPAPTKTGIPGATPKPTRIPVLLNLSSVCGYTFDNFEQWRVANRSSQTVDFVWRVKGSSEHGSASVAGNGVTYFTTSAGMKTVEVVVDNQVIDTESCLAPCKKEIELSFTCTSSGLTWHATNANSFGVDFTVKVDNQAGSKGTIPPNSTVEIATTSRGAHTVELTWTDSRPGTRTVTLSSPPNSCSVNITETPTPTFTHTPTETSTGIPVVIPSKTPTPTNTVPVVTATFTHTPTPTSTGVPVVIPTHTFTPTATSIQRAPTSTFTPTPTGTALAGFVPTSTTVPTATAIVTLAQPSGSITSTPVLIPVTGVDLTRPIGANSLSIFGGFLTNFGLFTLGLALALTGINHQIKN